MSGHPGASAITMQRVVLLSFLKNTFQYSVLHSHESIPTATHRTRPNPRMTQNMRPAFVHDRRG